MAATDIVPTHQKPLAFQGASTDGKWTLRTDLRALQAPGQRGIGQFAFVLVVVMTRVLPKFEPAASLPDCLGTPLRRVS